MDDLSAHELTQERITILADSFDSAAMEFPKRRMASKGYRLENSIAGNHLYMANTEGANPH